MAGALLEVTGLSKRFGGFVALDGIDLSVAAGERVGLIGPNGSGKSTLVNCICGTLVNETGSVRFDGETVDGLLTHERTRRGMARSFQLPRPFVTLTVADKHSTLVTVTEKSRENDEAGIKWLQGNTEGWANFLACLKAYLEYGINLRKGAFDFMKRPANKA